jgi:glutamate--cysteine ligase catalytic subunit
MFKFLDSYIGKNTILSISAFPLLGVDNDYYYFSPDAVQFYKDNGVETSPNQNNISNSQIFDDVIISSHKRFKHLSISVRQRIGKNIKIRMPLYKDLYTNSMQIEKKHPEQGFITLDAEGFGTGCCCFQMTLGFPSLNDAVFAYDQFVPLTPIIVNILLKLARFISINKYSKWDVDW